MGYVFKTANMPTFQIFSFCRSSFYTWFFLKESLDKDTQTHTWKTKVNVSFIFVIPTLQNYIAEILFTLIYQKLKWCYLTSMTEKLLYDGIPLSLELYECNENSKKCSSVQIWSCTNSEYYIIAVSTILSVPCHYLTFILPQSFSSSQIISTQGAPF